MRKSPTLASALLSRSVGSASGGSAGTVYRRLLQVALYGSSSGGRYGSRRWFNPLLDSLRGSSSRAASLGLAGAVCAAAAATSLSQDAYAKEPPPPEVVPKDVVLYQYEACPFCNKVKGAGFLFSADLMFSWLTGQLTARCFL